MVFLLSLTLHNVNIEGAIELSDRVCRDSNLKTNNHGANY